VQSKCRKVNDVIGYWDVYIMLWWWAARKRMQSRPRSAFFRNILPRIRSV